MKKLTKKLRLDRETVLHLDPREIGKPELAKARGGIEWTGCDSACTECTFAEGVLIGD